MTHQHNQHLLMFKKHQYKKRQRNQLSLVPKKHQHKRRSHNQLSLVHKRRNNNRLSLVHKKHNRKLLLQMLRLLKHNQPLQGLKQLQSKECQIKQCNHKLVLRMLKLVNKQLLLTVNLFNQVKTFNLSMAKP